MVSKRAPAAAAEDETAADRHSLRRTNQPSEQVSSGPRPPRRVYPASFKIMVVEQALRLPAHNRIKPTCRAFPGVEPVQVRKWIRNLAALQEAEPDAKLVQRRALPSPPALVADDAEGSSETESVVSHSPSPRPFPAKRPRASSSSRSRSVLGRGSVAATDVMSVAECVEEVCAARELLALCHAWACPSDNEMCP